MSAHDNSPKFHCSKMNRLGTYEGPTNTKTLIYNTHIDSFTSVFTLDQLLLLYNHFYKVKLAIT